jgi:hypothetical protein
LGDLVKNLEIDKSCRNCLFCDENIDEDSDIEVCEYKSSKAMKCLGDLKYPFPYSEWRDKDENFCPTCLHYNVHQCMKADGVVCNVEKTWRSWEVKSILSDEYIETQEVELPDVSEWDDGNPFNTQVGGTHYKKAEGCPDVAEWCGMQQVEFLEGNVIKYTFRHERKNGIEDLRKAQQYLRFIAWVKYNEVL